MKKILVLPTWLIYKAICPFLGEKHEFYKSKLSLNDWYAGSTQLNKRFSLVFWLIPLMIFLIVY